VRKSIEFIKKSYTHSLVGAEIGVATGVNAKNILENLNIKRLYLIDNIWRDDIFKNLTSYMGKINILTLSSIEASKILNETFDFIYIDAKHAYPSMKMDIDAWLPKIRSGGVLCGHDYQIEDVRKAVEELFSDKFYTKRNNDNDTIDWWFVK